MIERVFGKTIQAPGTFARLKVSDIDTARVNTGLTAAEKSLTDLLDLSPQVQAGVQKSRKVDGYLRLFGAVLKFFNGFGASSAKANLPRAEVEFFTPERKTTTRIDA